MKWLLIFWAAPVLFLFTWYGLSYYDINFGFFMLRRDMHDLVFQIYGQVLGVPPEDVPLMVLRAIIFDTFLVFGIYAWRRRADIRAWWEARKAARADTQPPSSEPVAALPMEDSLSRAP